MHCVWLTGLLHCCSWVAADGSVRSPSAVLSELEAEKSRTAEAELECSEAEAARFKALEELDEVEVGILIHKP